MSHPIEEILARNRSRQFVGREAEIQELLDAALGDAFAVVHIHGINGIGKTALFGAFGQRARDSGLTVIQLDCREIEPSEAGFLSCIAEALAMPISSVTQAEQAFRDAGDRVVLALDTYEVFRMMDTWFRLTFLPALSDNVRVFFFGRELPVSAWLIAPEWQGLFHSITLGPIDDGSSEAMLRKCGLDEPEVTRIRRFGRGHPLALRLAAASVLERPEMDLDEITSQTVVAELTHRYISEVQDLETRHAVEACSVVRRMTESMMRAMLPEVDVESVFPTVQALPFVETTKAGLALHDMVQQAVSSTLKASDPVKFRELRKGAWRFYKNEVSIAQRAKAWRYSADMLFLVEEPLVHDAFFPTNLQPFAIEQARPEDAPGIRAIIDRHEGDKAAAVLERWLNRVPECFYGAKDESGSLAGFYMLFDPTEVPEGIVRDDPVTRRLCEQLKDDPTPAKQKSIICRRWLDAKTGEGLSPVIGACFLDIKGYYVALKPSLRRLYCVRTDHEEYAPLFGKLLFNYLKDYTVDIDDSTYHTDLLDFGPALFNGWVSRLVGSELGVGQEGILDSDACELVLDGRREALTPLELGLMQCFLEHEGEVVTRVSLLETVWGYRDHSGASNVVDTKVRSIRKKLGENAGMIETVSGMGYRFRRS